MEIIGIDPGLVHTGLVMMRFLPHVRAIELGHEAIVGPDAAAAQQWLHKNLVATNQLRIVPTFIEAYRSRGNSYNTDDRMREAVMNFKKQMPWSRVIDNTGVKKVVGQPLMELLGVWSWPTTTHHQDLRSAARIGLYGALKEEHLNQLIYTVVDDHLKGRTWDVRHLA